MKTAEVEVIAPPQDAVQQLSGIETWAAELTISTAEQYNTAVFTLKGVKTLQTSIEAFFAPMKTRAHAAWKAVVGQETSLTGRLKNAETAAKAKLTAYHEAEEAKRQAEQRRLQAIADERARKEREAAEAAARLQREKEAQAQREADEARRKAAEATNAKERERLNREAEARQKAATAAAAKAQAKDEQAAQVAAPVIEVAKSAPTAAGTSFATVHKARVVNVALVPREFMILNEKALAAFAVATKGAVAVAGVEFYTEQKMSVSTR